MMVMLGCISAQIITRYTVAEVDFLYNMQLTQQFEGTVHGCQTDFGSLFFNEHEYVFCTQMIFFILKKYS
ncbi:hypothetical protein D3C76_1390220 [compost metagenome]